MGYNMHDILPLVIFYIFAAVTVLTALLVITQNNPVRCVLFLVLAFFTSSILWILAEAEFLALILVLIYVGAVMTLFLFVVMMLNIDVESMRKHFMRYLPFGLIVVAMLVGLLVNAIPKGSYKTAVEISTALEQAVQGSFVPEGVIPMVKPLSNTEALGMVLYTDYLFAFELAAVILLVAIIAAITLVHRKPHHSKRQNILKQIMTRREDRVKLLHMKSGK